MRENKASSMKRQKKRTQTVKKRSTQKTEKEKARKPRNPFLGAYIAELYIMP